MQNGLFTTSWAAVGESVLTGAVIAVVGTFGVVVVTHGFSVWTADWIGIGKNMVDVGFLAAVSTLVKDLITTNSGSVLGITPNN